MQIWINGQDVRLAEDQAPSLDQLLVDYKLKKNQVVIELNQTVPEKGEYASIFLRDGDKVEIVKFMGGG